jgi:transcriptional repressor NrdR
LKNVPHVENAFRSLVHDIERDILRVDGHEIRSSDIGEIVMKHLQGFDKVAFIRFASVYRQFEDVKTFQETLDRLTEAAKQRKKRAS